MSDRRLVCSFTASSLIHLMLIPVAALVMQARPIEPARLPIELIDIPPAEQPKQVAPPPVTPPPPSKTAKITAPKLLSKPEIIKSRPQPPTDNTREQIKEPEQPVEEPPQLAALPETPGSVEGGWNAGERAGEAEGSAAGTGNLFGKGDAGIVDGSGVEGGGGGQASSGFGRGGKGDGTGGGASGSGEGLSSVVRPLGGYQVKPRYPEAARRVGAQGIAILKINVLDNGRVGEVLIEKSAGFRDLDFAAVEAVKKWLFEPARRGKEQVAVWVLLPINFELR